MGNTRRYVLGFAWHHGSVLLIEKPSSARLHPQMLNGIGGSIEDGEAALDAMVREFREETGLTSDAHDWIEFGTLSGTGWHVTLFAVECDEDSGRPGDGYVTDEGRTRWVDPLPAGLPWNAVPNLEWLVPLSAGAIADGFSRVTVVEDLTLPEPEPEKATA